MGRQGLGKRPSPIACTHCPGHLLPQNDKECKVLSGSWCPVGTHQMPAPCCAPPAPPPPSPAVSCLLSSSSWVLGQKGPGTDSSLPWFSGGDNGWRACPGAVLGAGPGQGARGAEVGGGASWLGLMTAYLPKNRKVRTACSHIWTQGDLADHASATLDLTSAQQQPVAAQALIFHSAQSGWDGGPQVHCFCG